MEISGPEEQRQSFSQITCCALVVAGMLLLACLLVLYAWFFTPSEEITWGKAQYDFKYAIPCPKNIPVEWNYTIKTSKLSRTKYEVSFATIEDKNSPQKKPWNFTAKFEKHSISKYEIDIKTHIGEPITDQFQVEMALAIWSNGGWKPNFHRFAVPKFCTALYSYLKKGMVRFAKESGVKPGCPLPAGPMGTASRHEIDMNKYINQNALPYIKFRATTYFIKNKKKLLCFYLFADIIPA